MPWQVDQVTNFNTLWNNQEFSWGNWTSLNGENRDWGRRNAARWRFFTVFFFKWLVNWSPPPTIPPAKIDQGLLIMVVWPQWGRLWNPCFWEEGAGRDEGGGAGWPVIIFGRDEDQPKAEGPSKPRQKPFQAGVTLEPFTSFFKATNKPRCVTSTWFLCRSFLDIRV